MPVPLHTRNSADRQPATAAVAFVGERSLLLLALYEELLNSALLVAATASIGNAFSFRRRSSNPYLLKCYLPPAPMLFPQARLSLCAMADMAGLLSRLGDYYDHLVFLRDLTTGSLSGVISGDTIEHAQIAQIVGGWRNLIGDGLGAIEELARVLDAGQRSRCEDRHETAVDLLTRAEAGETPCIDAYGAVTIPLWVDRRRAKRCPRNLQAYLEVGGSLRRVAVIDVSERGIGVLGIGGAAEGAEVSLLLRPGVSIPGRVVWTRGNRAGIALDCALPADCQLVAHLH